jgi:hypothetical protein
VAVAELPGRVLAQDPGRLAGGVALDHSAVRLEVAAGARERGRVEPERVVVLRGEDHRRVGRDRVERGPRGRLGPVGVAPAEPAQPPAGRHGREPVDDAPDGVLQRPHPVQAHAAAGERPGREVDVRVVEAGQQAAAAEVDALGVGRRARGHAAGCDREPLDHRRAGVERADRAVLEEEVGPHPTRR